MDEDVERAQRRAARISGILLVGSAPWLLVTAVAAVLTAVATTAPGRAMGLGFVVLNLAVAGFVLLDAPARRTLASATVLAAAAFGFAGWAAPDGAAVAPDGLHPGSGLQSVWEGALAFSRFGLANLTPERDQGVLATWLTPVVDPFLDFREAAAFRDSLDAVYAELEADADYARAGSVQGLAYDELVFGRVVTGHTWVDLAPADGPQPAIVLLHGYGGNLKAYTWALRRAAHARGYAVVAPSFGAGFWYEARGDEVIEATWRWMERSGRFDMSRVVIAGLSNGGFGVTRNVLAHPDRWRGVAYLSGVLDDTSLGPVAAALVEQAGSGGRPAPLLLLHGARDDRIPLWLIEAGAVAARANGVEPMVHVVDDADHFLLFTHRDAVDRAVGRWLDEVAAR